MKLLLIALTITLDYSVYASNTRGEDSCRYICYHKKVKLSWNDFQGQVDSSLSTYSLANAVSKISILVKKTYSGDTLKFNVLNRFDKSVSWVLEPKDTSSQLLRHEQLHFDISELYARKIRKILSQIDQDDIDNFDFRGEVSKILSERDERDAKYDYETNHGVLLDEQKRWNEKIMKELAELEAYSDDTVICLCE